MLAKAEWGVKRICPGCSARYYDMRKNPPICPTCGVKFDPEALLKSRRVRATSADSKRAAKPVAAAVVVPDPVEAVVAEDPEAEIAAAETEDVIEDVEDIDDDEEVVEVEDEEG